MNAGLDNIGILCQDHGGAALVVFQGLATGSLLYVVFFEILEKERRKPVPGVLQVTN